MPNVHYQSPPYEAPAPRGGSASPASSLRSEYPPDATSASDRDLSDEAFARKTEDAFDMRGMRKEEVAANAEIRIPQPKTAAEEQALHESIMKKLRERVAALEEEQLFDAVAQNVASPGFEPQPTSYNYRNIVAQSIENDAAVAAGRLRQQPPPPWPLPRGQTPLR